MSVTEQKSDLRAIIHERIEEHISEHPEQATDIAMGAVRRLSGKMTLRELQDWHFALFAKELILEAEQ